MDGLEVWIKTFRTANGALPPNDASAIPDADEIKARLERVQKRVQESSQVPAEPAPSPVNNMSFNAVKSHWFEHRAQKNYSQCRPTRSSDTWNRLNAYIQGLGNKGHGKAP